MNKIDLFLNQISDIEHRRSNKVHLYWCQYCRKHFDIIVHQNKMDGNYQTLQAAISALPKDLTKTGAKIVIQGNWAKADTQGIKLEGFKTTPGIFMSIKGV